MTVRDAESHALLQRHGVKSRLSFDTAFVLQPGGDEIAAATTLFDRAGFDANRTALISVRNFDGIYRHDPEGSLAKFVQLADALTKRGHQVGILVQSDVGAADSDRHIAQTIHAHVPAAKIFDLFDGPSGIAPVDLLLGVLNRANIVIGLRYHATVLRLAGGRQVYNLPYSRKGRELGDRLALTGCPLEDFEPCGAIAAIEATADRQFDAKPAADDVRHAFADAMEAVQ